MTISSNTLFHFTRRYEYFSDALKNGLWPRFCVEHDWNGMNLAIPMICFCDIPLSQIHNHTARYGKFGIGVTKEFAKRNDITPVLYIDPSSKLKTQSLKRVLSDYTKPKTEESSIEFSEVMLYYIKRTEGIELQKKNNKLTQVHVKFYDEKEWRYIPPITNTVHLFKENKRQPLDVKELCLKTKNQRLKLLPQDIQYLIVRSEKDIIKLYDDIDKFFASSSEYDRKMLKTKIIYIQNIKNDF